jgi:nicotinate-nucleotide adenylyltransferase
VPGEGEAGGASRGARAAAGRSGQHAARQALTPVRLGVLGGTFDPPHLGHLLAASDAFEALALDRLLFVPAAQQPFKAGRVGASPEQRAAMCELMLGVDARFAVDRSEILRGGLSYTVDTLAALAAAEPGVALFLLIGEDLAEQVGTWREAPRIAELAEIAVMSREAGAAAAPAGGLPMRRIATRRVELSSTEVRARVKAGRPINGYVADPVARYIRDTGLYR